MNAAFEWSPLLPYLYSAGLALAAALVVLIARWKRTPDLYWRGAFFILLAALLLNPIVVHEERKGLPDKLLILVDDSPSQDIAQRSVTAAKALEHITQMLKDLPNVEPVVLRGGQDAASLKNQNTSLFAVLGAAMADIPAGQVAGTVLITDGQVHDVPPALKGWEKLAPFHVVLTGRKDEFDRKVTIVEAPKYGLLSQDVTIKVKVEDAGRAHGAAVPLDVRQDGKSVSTGMVNLGEELSYTFKLDHPGQNVFEFVTPAGKDEMTAMNNAAAVIVNGIRDRLKVLLVSGQPHIGERAWRDLLKSDPAIDLVHFTILRSPTSFDATPVREMSLIAFPVQELFERKIRDFDLIIFDKYAQYGLLQPQYFVNIASFVKEGGAFFMAMGSDKLEESLFNTAVGDILPIEPKAAEDSILSGAYLPQLTETGKTHPVTGDLRGADKEKPWGGWYTQVDVNVTKGETLMTGRNGRPLLILDKVGDGRVGVLTSDNIWMWSKSVNGGGPYTDLLRHVAHWLMKEPELEEDFIKADVKGSTITVSARSLAAAPRSVTLTRPNGAEETLPLTAAAPGWLSAQVQAGQNGIYRFTNGSKTAYAIIGTATSQEFSDVQTTEDKLKPLVQQTKGSLIWFNEDPGFSLTRVGANSSHFGGRGWLGIKENKAYEVKNVKSAPFIPNAMFLLIILAGLLLMWLRESGKTRRDV